MLLMFSLCRMSYTEEDTAGRPKLSLQPRGSASDIASSSPAKSSRVSLTSFCGSGIYFESAIGRSVP